MAIRLLDLVLGRRDRGKKILYLIVTRHRRAIPVENGCWAVEFSNRLSPNK